MVTPEYFGRCSRPLSHVIPTINEIKGELKDLSNKVDRKPDQTD